MGWNVRLSNAMALITTPQECEKKCLYFEYFTVTLGCAKLTLNTNESMAGGRFYHPHQPLIFLFFFLMKPDQFVGIDSTICGMISLHYRKITFSIHPTF